MEREDTTPSTNSSVGRQQRASDMTGNGDTRLLLSWPMPDEKDVSSPVTGDIITENRYVGFCDILGFSNRILADFDGTLKIYKDFAETFSKVPAKEAEVTMYSDAILITGNSVGRVACAIQNLWFIALANDLMIHGAICKGRYWERREGNHMLVASWFLKGKNPYALVRGDWWTGST